MITTFTDEVTKASAEFHEDLGSQAAKIASAHSDWVYMHPDFRAKAQETVDNINQDVLSRLQATLRIGRELLEGKKKYPRRKEFAEFREKQFITPAEGRKAMNLVQQFGDWVEEKLLVVNSVVNLATLCHSKFSTLVQQLREIPNLTKELVKNLVKEVRDATKTERQKKPLTDSCSGWRQDPSGGGRHYQLPPMYNEEAAMKIESLAKERRVRAIVVVEEAIVAYTDQPTVDQLKQLHQEEMQAAVTEMRDEHIQMQREIIELKQQVQAPEPVIHTSSTWTEFADSVNCDPEGASQLRWHRSVLLGTVKIWSHSERQALATLLANYLNEEQTNLDLSGS